MLKTLRILMATCFLLTVVIIAQAQTQPRVAGYYPSYRTTAGSLPYNCLTDILYAFINFKTDGHLYTDNSTVGGDAQNVFGFDATQLAVLKSSCKPAVSNGPN